MKRTWIVYRFEDDEPVIVFREPNTQYHYKVILSVFSELTDYMEASR